MQVNRNIAARAYDSICVQSFHYLTVAWVKLGVDMSSSMHIDNTKK